MILAPSASQKTAYLSFIGVINDKNVETLIARANAEVNAGATTLHLGISSPGGAVNSGVTAYQLLKGLPVELVTHNTGSVGSIANAIFLAGSRRYSGQFATFYFHGTTGGQPNSNAAALQSAIQGIEIDNSRTVDLIVKETGMSADDARALLTSVGTTITAQGAKEKGLVHDIRDWHVPPGASFFQFILPT